MNLAALIKTSITQYIYNYHCQFNFNSFLFSYSQISGAVTLNIAVLELVLQTQVWHIWLSHRKVCNPLTLVIQSIKTMWRYKTSSDLNSSLILVTHLRSFISFYITFWGKIISFEWKQVVFIFSVCALICLFRIKVMLIEQTYSPQNS